MDINTRDFGVIQVDQDSVYDFPKGIYGFENDNKFAIFEKTFEDVSFLYLQSVNNLNPCFLVFEPQDFYPNYEPDLSKEDLELCQVETQEELIFLVISTVPASLTELSLNMKSPIVLNTKTKKAMQVILQNPDYTIKYKPFLDHGKEGSSC